MTRLSVTWIIIILFLTFKTSTGSSHSITDVVTDGVENAPDDQTTELPLLMNMLDMLYTPQCLRVLLLMQDEKGNTNSSIAPEASQISESMPLTFSEDNKLFTKLMESKVISESKSSIRINFSGKTRSQVEDIFTYINKMTERVASTACVSYLLSGPPDSRLLPVLTDPTSSKRLTRYFLVHTQNSTEAEQFLLDQRLGKEENVAALVQEESQNKSYWRVLIRQLLHPSGSPQVLTVNKWSRDTGLTSTENMFPDQMANFYGQQLRGVTLDYIPFADYEQTEGSLFVKMKPCVNKFIINTIARKLNFTYRMAMPADGQWGYVNDEGHFVGVVGDVEFGRANFAFDLTVTLERARHVDFTYYYYFDPLTFITSKSRPDPRWRKLITPFRASVWIAIVVSVGGGSLLYHIIYHAQATLPSSHLLSSHAFMQVLASFLSQSLRSYLSLQSGKVFLGFWFLYSFLITTHYKTSLTSTLAVPFAPSTVDTLQELFQSGLSFGMQSAKGSAYALFSTSDVPLYRTMFQQMTFHTAQESMLRVAAGEHSYVYFKSNLKLLVAMHNNNPKRKTDIHIATEEFFPSFNGCAVPQGSPYLPNFNAVMQKCLEAGLITKWIDDAMLNFLKEPQEEETAAGEETSEDQTEKKANTRFVVFNLNHLQGAFFFFFLGNVGGGLLLLLEVLVC